MFFVTLALCSVVLATPAQASSNGNKAINFTFNWMAIALAQTISGGFTFGGQGRVVTGPRGYYTLSGTSAGAFAAGWVLNIYLNWRHSTSMVIGLEGDYFSVPSPTSGTGVFASANFGPNWFVTNHLNFGFVFRGGYGFTLSGVPSRATPFVPYAIGFNYSVEGFVGIAF